MIFALEIIGILTFTVDYLQNRVFYDGEIIRTIETQYYYDTNNYLDSIIKRTGKEIEVTSFKKNKYGDPISEIEKMSKETLAYKTYTYLYDNNNNWIRRLEENHKPSGFNSNKTYTLIVREIKY